MSQKQIKNEKKNGEWNRLIGNIHGIISRHSDGLTDNQTSYLIWYLGKLWQFNSNEAHYYVAVNVMKNVYIWLDGKNLIKLN